MGFFDFFQGDGFGAAATVDGSSDQEALGQSIVDKAIYDQSVNDLAAANDRAALAFEGQYQHATAGPDYDPFADDPYHGLTQETLGRAIVQQSQGKHVLDDTPLSFLNSADVGAWANVAGKVKNLVDPNSVTPVAGAPRQIFSNRPGQGGGFVINPNRQGAAVNRAGSQPVPGVMVLGLVAVGVYLATR